MAQAPRDNNRVPTVLGTSNADGSTPLPPYVDSTTNRLLVDSRSEDYGHGSVGTGAKTVTTAGTRVQLSATSVSCKRVFIQASDGNSGTIVVGGSSVVAAQATRQGVALFASQGDWFNVSDLNLLYIDSTVNGDIVNYYYEN